MPVGRPRPPESGRGRSILGPEGTEWGPRSMKPSVGMDGPPEAACSSEGAPRCLHALAERWAPFFSSLQPLIWDPISAKILAPILEHLRFLSSPDGSLLASWEAQCWLGIQRVDFILETVTTHLRPYNPLTSDATTHPPTLLVKTASLPVLFLQFVCKLWLTYSVSFSGTASDSYSL